MASHSYIYKNILQWPVVDDDDTVQLIFFLLLMQQITIRVQHQGNHSILSIWRHRCNMWVKERQWRQNDPMWPRFEPFFATQSIYPFFKTVPSRPQSSDFCSERQLKIICKRLGQIYHEAFIVDSRRTSIWGYFWMPFLFLQTGPN